MNEKIFQKFLDFNIGQDRNLNKEQRYESFCLILSSSPQS